jgi:hypothetical protein
VTPAISQDRRLAQREKKRNFSRCAAVSAREEGGTEVIYSRRLAASTASRVRESRRLPMPLRRRSGCPNLV